MQSQSVMDYARIWFAMIFSPVQYKSKRE